MSEPSRWLRLEPDERGELQANWATPWPPAPSTQKTGVLLRNAVDHWHETGDGRREADALSRLDILLGSAVGTGTATVAAERARILLEDHPSGPELAMAFGRLASLHMLARDPDQAAAWGSNHRAGSTGSARPSRWAAP